MPIPNRTDAGAAVAIDRRVCHASRGFVRRPACDGEFIGLLLNFTGSLRNDGRRESKVACGPAAKTLRSPCAVISVGSNGEAAFETAIHTIAPQCTIDVWDGTLNAAKRARVPTYSNLQFVARNFKPDSHLEYAGRRRISLLKMDCEGCEIDSLHKFLEAICTDQVIVEVHAYPRLWMGTNASPPEANGHTLSQSKAAHQFDGLAAFFARLGTHYSPFFGEYNPSCGPVVRCFEVSYVRRVPCANDDRVRRRYKSSSK